MTPKQAVRVLREYIGDRKDHHQNCSLHQRGELGKCNCYARHREKAHSAVDVLEERAKK